MSLCITNCVILVLAGSPDRYPSHVVPMTPIHITVAKVPEEEPLTFPFFNRRTRQRATNEESVSRWKKLFDGKANSSSQEQSRDREASSLFSFLNRDSQPVSNQMLVSRCRGLLFTDTELSGSSIAVLADNGVVTLRGTVATAALRDRAARLVEQTSGVNGVKNELRIEGSIPQWFRQNAVTLAPPKQTEVRRIDAAPALEEVPSRPLSTLSLPPLQVLRPTEPQQPERPKAIGPATIRPSEPIARAEPVTTGPVVVLGKPQWISTAPDLPIVKTYQIRRPMDQQQVVAQHTPATVSPGQQWQPSVRSFTIATTRSNEAINDADVQPTAQFAPQAKVQTFRPSHYEQAPATPMAMTRSDIDAVFRHDLRARGLRYRLIGGELELSGQATRPSDFYPFVDVLLSLPGVNNVSFGADFHFAR